MIMAFSNNLTVIDAGILELVLLELIPSGVVRFIEIGMNSGETARGIKEYVEERGATLKYCGIDSGLLGKPQSPFMGALVLEGDSAEVSPSAPDEVDAVFVDGCHSFNHVILDTFHYAPRVRAGGFLIYHDTAPHIQQTMREATGPDHPLFYNSVNAALLALRLREDNRWRLFTEGFDAESKIGGMTVFQKL